MVTEAVALTWDDVGGVLERAATAIRLGGLPQVIVGILRGGMIPAVMLAHAFGVRDVRGVDATHTLAEGTDAPKSALPLVRHPASLGDLAGQDVLIVDDAAGTGATMDAARKLVDVASAARVRTLVCAVNERNWSDDHRHPEQAFTAIGLLTAAWVTFPWELTSRASTK